MYMSVKKEENLKLKNLQRQLYLRMLIELDEIFPFVSFLEESPRIIKSID